MLNKKDDNYTKTRIYGASKTTWSLSRQDSNSQLLNQEMMTIYALLEMDVLFGSIVVYSSWDYKGILFYSCEKK